MDEVTYGPRSKANATLLLQAAAALGYPSRVVRTGRGGYLVPQDVLDAALGVDKIEEGVFYPAPPEPPSEEQTDVPVVDDKPRGNASREAWADYAKTLGITVGDDLSRDDIKNLVNEEE
jgi:hypothetical protein